MIDVKATIADSRHQWEETFKRVDPSDPHAGVQKVIDYFNSTLRPGERPRHIVSIDSYTPSSAPLAAHDWEKTNLVTITKGRLVYDTAKCRKCGATAKRFGLDAYFELDSKYKTLKYRTSCPGDE